MALAKVVNVIMMVTGDVADDSPADLCVGSFERARDDEYLCVCSFVPVFVCMYVSIYVYLMYMSVCKCECNHEGDSE